MCLGEPGVGRPLGLSGEPGEGLDGQALATDEVVNGLEDVGEAAPAQEALDTRDIVSSLPIAPGLSTLATKRSSAAKLSCSTIAAPGPS